MLTESLQRNICLAEGSLGQVTTKKTENKKTGITRPRPDSRVKMMKKKTRKAPGALDPTVYLPPLGVQNTARSLKI